MSLFSFRSRIPLAVVGVLALTLSSCSGSPTDTASSAGQPPSTPSAAGSAAVEGPVTVTNCGEEVTYPGPVTRIVATSNQANTGTLMRIGAVDRLAAAALRPGNDEVLTALYGPGLDTVARMDSPISMEAIVAVEPDLLIGSYSGLFAGSTGVTVEAANENGIATYVISDSCRQNPAEGAASKLGTMDPWDAVRADIQNYGELTGLTVEAEAALEEFNTRLTELQNAPQATTRPRILLFDSGTDELYTSGRNGPPQGIIEAAGGVNVFEDQDTTWFKASWEAVAETQPDVIIVLDYRQGDESEIAKKLDTIRTQPALADLDVVRQNRIIVLPLVLFTSGYPNLEAAAQVRAGLEQLGLVPDTDIAGELPESFGYGPIQG